MPGGFRPGQPKPAAPRFAPVGSWRGLSPRAPPPSVFPAGLPPGARRPPPPSPPPGSAAASFRARLPWTAARWAAGTPPPPARARAKVSAAGGWGRGDGDSGAVGSSAGRAASAGEARREAARRKDAGTSGRAGEQPPLPVPIFGTGADCPVLERPKAGHVPPVRGAVAPGRGEPAERSCGGSAGSPGGGAPLQRVDPEPSWERGFLLVAGVRTPSSRSRSRRPRPQPLGTQRLHLEKCSRTIQDFFGGRGVLVRWEELQTGL